MAPDSLVSLNDTLYSESERQLIQAEMSFITQHSESIIIATDVFQSQRPIAMTVNIHMFSSYLSYFIKLRSGITEMTHLC